MNTKIVYSILHSHIGVHFESQCVWKEKEKREKERRQREREREREREKKLRPDAEALCTEKQYHQSHEWSPSQWPLR